MDRVAMMEAVEQEIARLTEVRQLLSDETRGTEPKKRVGRPKGSTKKAKAPKAKRQLSPEARKRIADAQKKRWAAARGGK